MVDLYSQLFVKYDSLELKKNLFTVNVVYVQIYSITFHLESLQMLIVLSNFNIFSICLIFS